MDNRRTWELIHAERARLFSTLSPLSDEQWTHSSLCEGWTVLTVAGHVVAGAEQTAGHFMGRFVASGFRFNTMVDVDARRVIAAGPEAMLARFRSTLSATNHPPAPIVAMLGEVVAHGEDIRRPLGIRTEVSEEAIVTCLNMYVTMGFPVGSKKNAANLSFRADDVDWSHGSGPLVSGPAMSLLLAIVGRPMGLNELAGDGVGELRRRIT